jgi:hypothetical protein
MAAQKLKVSATIDFLHLADYPMDQSGRDQTLITRLTRTIQLADLAPVPGPLHSVLQDEQGNLYYTDEINHILASLNPYGDMRWYRKGPADLRYPRGFDLGAVTVDGATIPCVAVCDSWNRRIRFLDREGAGLADWIAAGENAFREPLDIRFLGGLPDGPEACCWLVLDRGHHCLFVLRLNGGLIGKIGRAFAESLEDQWSFLFATSGTSVPLADLVSGQAAYDPAFMPSRLFGASAEAVFIWQPNYRRLKQVFWGNLLPYWMELPRGMDCIAADGRGLQLYDFQTNTIRAFDLQRGRWRSTRISGTPIPSGRSSTEIWLQQGARVQHFVCDFGAETDPAGKNGAPQAAAHDAWVPVLSSPSSEGLTARILELKDVLQNLILLGERAHCLSDAQRFDVGCLEEVSGALQGIRSRYLEIFSEMEEFAALQYPAFLKTLHLRLLDPHAANAALFRQASAPIQRDAAELSAVFAELVCFRDNAGLANLAVQLASECAPEVPARWHALMEQFLDTSLEAMMKLAPWSWMVSAAEALDAPAVLMKKLEHDPCAWRFITRPPARSRRHLCELDRIYLGDPHRNAPVQPADLAHYRGQGILVTLQGTGKIMRLDEQGVNLGAFAAEILTQKPLRQPFGIAVDENGRVWLSEPASRCVRILDPTAGSLVSLDEWAKVPTKLIRPFGIHHAGGGTMLIADMNRNRVLAVSRVGEISVLTDRTGTTAGAFRTPASFCDADAGDAVWITDLRNHRLQKLRLDGTPLQQIGRPGLGRGCLYMPRFCAQFEDGAIVVCQWACTRELVLFSPDGEEMETVPLDYAPGGMLVHQGNLMACAASGDHVHVYRRA